MKKLFNRLPEKGIELVVQEAGKTRCYSLDNGEKWLLGRETPENKPDIPLKSEIAGRRHGEFLRISDQLFFVDRGSINGTFYNGEKLKKGFRGRANLKLLNDGDVLRIDCGNPDMPDPRSVHIKVRIKN